MTWEGELLRFQSQRTPPARGIPLRACAAATHSLCPAFVLRVLGAFKPVPAIGPVSNGVVCEGGKEEGDACAARHCVVGRSTERRVKVHAV